MIEPDDRVVDATYGRGGHSRAMLDRLGPQGRLVVIDQDPEAIEHARSTLSGDERVTIWQGNFAELGRMADELGLRGRIDALLMDVGVSSPQLDTPERGFSFRDDGPLDMRMNPARGESAADWLARAEEAEIARVIYEYGEEKFSRRIARSIVMARAEQPIERTAQLAAIVARAAGPSPADRHPATRTFQAIRIHVNDELGALDSALEQAVDVLAPGGRLAVISFHSLEDRRVKQAFKRLCSAPPASRRLPVAPDFKPRARTIGKLIRPAEAELLANPRARSSRLRVLEKLAEGPA
ncbi:16S rRNA (cytosine1402-N4)-methyltransferase [Wenzhouxiangella marina]|uniref:Ribosomal RNA small subunit methyltransferase H n=2 Tax=Wenzhouxiangella marina TaxID=1579979 RepID=A0A0K0XYH1_9GAMM|nr:16S rRNA methyltransferase [Wenzhouxiangella marina]MBB6088576.1 16S rRNA (cytosine1402-N4)-methyltransferase [Wenzhouxiangella marina]